jgi:hypothetical protein
MPLYRTILMRGGGTSAANFSIRSRGSKIMWVVPSRQPRLRRCSSLPFGRRDIRSGATGGKSGTQPVILSAMPWFSLSLAGRWIRPVVDVPVSIPAPTKPLGLLLLAGQPPRVQPERRQHPFRFNLRSPCRTFAPSRVCTPDDRGSSSGSNGLRPHFSGGSLLDLPVK